ncbi:cytidylate kinase-like family protein [Parabacteroides sp. OttesenSCG-928-N08]|nr:cytidylate kinase-like family protein [Parabacteroides sp. OttesenSCG-928-N08]
MKDNIVITIGRQYGSGGRIVGKRLAEALGISYYDKELLSVAAKESGLCEDVFSRADEQTTNSLSYALSLGYSYMGMFTPYSDILSNEGLFKLQSDAIRNLSEKESCILVGRCADYILRDNPNLISFFIHNRCENRIKNIIETEQCSEEAAKERIAKNDKSRASYYNYFTNKTWGAAASYHFSLDLSLLGVEASVEFMKELIERKQQLRPPHFG